MDVVWEVCTSSGPGSQDAVGNFVVHDEGRGSVVHDEPVVTGRVSEIGEPDEGVRNQIAELRSQRRVARS